MLEQAVTVFIALCIALGLGIGAIVLLKRYGAKFPIIKPQGLRRLQSIEHKRLTPRTAIFLIECDGKPYLIAENHNQICMLEIKSKLTTTAAEEVLT